MALSFLAEGRIYIVLDPENLTRIAANDPFDLFTGDGLSGLMRTPPEICIAFARPDEYATIRSLQDRPKELIAYLRRGYTETATDHERGFGLKPL